MNAPLNFSQNRLKKQKPFLPYKRNLQTVLEEFPMVVELVLMLGFGQIPQTYEYMVGLGYVQNNTENTKYK